MGVKNLSNVLKKLDLYNVLISSNFMIIEKLFNLFISLYVTSIIAKFLGPSDYGIYSLALTILALFASITNMGLDTVAINKIIMNNKSDLIISNSIILRFFGRLLVLLLASVVVIVLNYEIIILILVVVLAMSSSIRAPETIELWFIANNKLKPIFILKTFVYIFSSILKILAVLLQLNIVFFAIIYLIESIIVAILMMMIFSKNGQNFSINLLNLRVIKNLFDDSKYIIITGIFITTYMQIDKIMISRLMSYSETGVYSIAVQLSQIWFFVPLGVITAMKSKLLQQNTIEKFTLYLSITNKTVAFISFFAMIFYILFSKIFIEILFGVEYIKAYSVLPILVLSGYLGILGMIRTILMIKYKTQKYSTLFSFFTALLNILLNLYFIGQFGIIGAAVASLISQIINLFILPLWIHETRSLTYTLIKSIIPLKIKNR